MTQGSTPLSFTPDSTRIAAWSDNPNRVTLRRISDGVMLMSFAGAATNEAVGAIRFTPDDTHMVPTGYLHLMDRDGLGQQRGVIRFWRTDARTFIIYLAQLPIGDVTSPVAWSPDAARFADGAYEGTAVVATHPQGFGPERRCLVAAIRRAGRKLS